MRIIFTESYKKSAQAASDIILEAISEKPDLLLGMATGETFQGVYACVAEAYRKGIVDLSLVHTVNLDEYVGCAERDSYRKFMEHHLFDHVNIPQENITIADYRAEPGSEVARLRKYFSENRVDLQLLGMGANGHIGFNEPGSSLSVMTHIEELSKSTINANSRFFDLSETVPERAITMGMGDIMNARRILLVVHGESKRIPLEHLLEGAAVTTQNPASFLLLHPDVTVICQKYD